MTPASIAKLPSGIHGFGQGLQLVVSPLGVRSWRLRVLIAGKAKTTVLGQFPAISERAARDRAAEIAFELKRGIDKKAEARQAVSKSESDTLAIWAGKYLKASRSEWTPGYLEDSKSRLERYVSMTPLWQTPIAELDPVAVSAVLDGIYAERPDTAAKVKILLGAICRYARSKGRRDVSVVTTDLKLGSGRRGKAKTVKHLPALLEIDALRDVCRRTEAARISTVTKTMLYLQSRTAQRSLNVCSAQWSDFDLEEGIWTIPRANMKVSDESRGDHLVPLAPAVVERLKAYKKLKLHNRWLFPNDRSDGHATIESGSKFYNRGLGLSGKMTPHGWRSALKTLANLADNPDGSKRFDSRDIDAVTDHIVTSKTLAAYDRKRSLPRMRSVLIWWSEQLEAGDE